MNAPRFVHLRLHTEYSITDGIARVEEAVSAAADDGMPALAITDNANLFGAIKFHQAARAHGVQPLIGCDLWVTNEKNRDAASRVAVLCRDAKGYHALCELLSRAHVENHWRGRAEVRRELAGGALLLLQLRDPAVGIAVIDADQDVIAEQVGHRRLPSCRHPEYVLRGHGLRGNVNQTPMRDGFLPLCLRSVYGVAVSGHLSLPFRAKV